MKSGKLDTKSLDNLNTHLLPFTLEYEEQLFPLKSPLPGIQSYVSAIASDGSILIIGGRLQGLHTFQPHKSNFPTKGVNTQIFVINPNTGDLWSFDLQKLDFSLAGPLQAANLQGCVDRDTGNMYVVGGYGWDEDQKNMLTYNTLISFNVDLLVSAIKGFQSASEITKLMRVVSDDRFAVTGGELHILNGKFYLVFGQEFQGQYRAFGGSGFSQKYINEIRIFKLSPNDFSILEYGVVYDDVDSDQPFHRRDGNIVPDLDPADENPRISAFGGVFQPGKIAAYTNPIYIKGDSTPQIDRNVNQKFCQYNCPVMSVYDSSSKSPTIFHTFFGGISHYYYHQTEAQKQVYADVTKQGRNDGFPYVCDISTLMQTKDGATSEYINLKPIKDNRLLGTSVSLIPNPALADQNLAFENGVVKLADLKENNKYLMGYIYGGIEAEFPLPKIPNAGTSGTNSLFAVYITKKPSPVIPASEGTEAIVKIVP